MKRYFSLYIVFALFAAVLPFSSLALSIGDDNYIPIEPSSGPIVLGEWNSSVEAGKTYADANNVPMIAIFGTKYCTHCHAMQSACNTEEFKAWAAEKKIVMVFSMDNETKKFCKPDDSVSLPFVAIYWQKPDGTDVYVRFTGMIGYMPSKEGDTIAAQLINSCDMYLGGYPDVDASGHLAFTATYPRARLEAEVGKTLYVDVPLEREALAIGHVGTNVFTVVYRGEKVAEETILWGAESVAKSQRVDIPVDAAPGEEIGIALRSIEGEDCGTTKIFVVGEVENSTKNPLFIGEKTVDELGYGEWTMDLDVAMAKYRKELDAHLMVIASGALWCPDCVMTDEHVLETAEFKQWAVDNKVILVDLDVPNFGPREASSACLLTRTVVKQSDGYVSGRGTLATNELERYQSGAGYLSRHMISDADAKRALERNRSLVGRNTLDGGWNNPDRANQDRTGIPNFFALRRDGTLAGTFEAFDAIGPSGYNAAYLLRFSELIALAATDGGEFSNRAWQTTRESFSGAGEISDAALTPLDLIDVYKLAPTTDVASEQTITVLGSDASTVVTVSLFAVVDGQKQTLATASGRLAEGVVAIGVIASSGDYYVAVEGGASGALAADSEAMDAAVAYTLDGSRKKIDNPFSNEWTAKDASATLPLYAVGGDRLAGTLALTLKKNGKIKAKFSDGKRVVASFSGKWGADISIDGTAAALLEKKGYTLKLSMSGEGVLKANVSNGVNAMSSGKCAIADEYDEFVGNYTAVLPISNSPGETGDAYMTLSMAAGKSAVSKGKIKFAVFLPDGKRLSGTTGISGHDANFGLVPIIKRSGANYFSAAVLVRRRAGEAMTRRAVIAMPGVKAELLSGGVVVQCGIYGSLIDRNESLVELANATSVEFAPDVSGIGKDSEYGVLTGIVYKGGILNVLPEGIVPADRPKGFSFKLDRRTGVFKGKTSLSFVGKSKVVAKFGGVILPNWYSDCECQEDGDVVVSMEFLPFGAGYGIFTDKINGSRAKRSFSVGLGQDSSME